MLPHTQHNAFLFSRPLFFFFCVCFLCRLQAGLCPAPELLEAAASTLEVSEPLEEILFWRVSATFAHTRVLSAVLYRLAVVVDGCVVFSRRFVDVLAKRFMACTACM